MNDTKPDINILIVDDDTAMLNSLERCLRGEGYLIRTATSYSEAMDLIAQVEFALVICDYKFPDISGSELLAVIKQRCPKCIRIMLTGVAVVDSAPQQVKDNILHCHEFVVKPWNRDKLRQLIRDSLANISVPANRAC